MDNVQNEAVTVTNTDTHSELEHAGLLLGLKKLDASIDELKSAGMMGKAEKAEKVVSELREVVAGNVMATHKLFNETKRLRAEIEGLNLSLENLRKHGFGG